MNDFVENILQSNFYACCYILLSGTRPKRRCTHIPICGCYFRCHWCRNLVQGAGNLQPAWTFKMAASDFSIS